MTEIGKIIKPLLSTDEPASVQEESSAREQHQHPAQSFNDDHVGARITSEEAALKRAVIDRDLSERPQEILTEFDKVAEASAFRAAEEDQQTYLLRQQEALTRRKQHLQQKKTGNKRQLGQAHSATAPAAEGGEAKTASKRLAAKLAAALAILSDLESTPDLPEAKALTTRLQAQLRAEVQALLARTNRLQFLGSPVLFLYRVLKRLPKWPKNIPPGHGVPEEEEQVEAFLEAFLAWIYTVPAFPEDILNPEE